MYCILDDLKKSADERTIAQLTDDDAGAAVNKDVVTEATAASDEVIDAHLRGRYDLPLSPVPPILKQLSVAMTLFHLYARRPEGEIPEAVETRYKNAVRMLGNISDGKLTIGSTAQGPAVPEGDVYMTQKKKTDRLFADIDN